jgi:hypothetical protein
VGQATVKEDNLAGTTIDLSDGNNLYHIELGTNSTLTFTNVPSEGEWSVMVKATATITLAFSHATMTVQEMGADALAPPDSGNWKLFHFWTVPTYSTTIFAGYSA